MVCEWPFIGILFLVLIVYIVATEIQSQDCDRRLCYNTTPQPHLNDDPETIIDKLITTLRPNHTPVEWRKSLLIGLVVAYLVITVLGVPLMLSRYVLTTLIIFIFVYVALTWTSWVYWRHLDTQIERKLIQQRLSLN